MLYLGLLTGTGRFCDLNCMELSAYWLHRVTKSYQLHWNPTSSVIPSVVTGIGWFSDLYGQKFYNID